MGPKHAPRNGSQGNGNGHALARRKVGRPPKSSPKIDLEKALKLRLTNGLSYAEIGEYFGVGKTAVQQRLKRFMVFLDDPEAIAAYRVNKNDILEAAELRLLASLVDEEAILKGSLNNRAYTFQQIATQHRLERGNSTENIGFLSKIIIASDRQPSKPPKLLEEMVHSETPVWLNRETEGKQE